MADIESADEEASSGDWVPPTFLAKERKRGAGGNRVLLIFALSFALVLVLGVLAVLLVRHSSDSAAGFTADFPEDVPSLDGQAAGDGLMWTVENGTFSTSAGAAYGVPADTKAAKATVTLKTPANRIEVSFDEVYLASGFIFRRVDDQNYWAVVAVPDYGTWNVLKIVNGRSTFVANTGANLKQRSTSVTVEDKDGAFSVSVDGGRPLVVNDTALANGRGLGMLASPKDAGKTRWALISASQ